MPDLLKSLCINSGIKLIYTNNTYVFISSGFQYNVPVIRVQKLLKNCPLETASAILNYCTGYDQSGKNLETINSYIVNSLGIKKFQISNPNISFIKYFQKYKAVDNNQSDKITENRIVSMTVQSFNSEIINMDPDEAIKVNGDDIAEVNIVITPD